MTLFLSFPFMFQSPSFCAPNASSCYRAVSTSDTYGCLVSCTGLYADMTFSEDSLYKDIVDGGNMGKEFQDRVKLGRILQKYTDHKTNYANNIKFDPTAQNLSKNF